MEIHDARRVFRPPQARRRSRIILGLALSTLTLGGVAIAAAAILLPRTLSYEIDGQQLIVTRGFKIKPSRKVVPLSQVIEARSVQLQRGKRRAGTAMPGYCTGHFSFPTLGSVDLASDCSRNAVKLELKEAERPLVLTPGNRQAFLSALGGEGRYEEIFHPGTDPGPGWKIFRVLLALMLLPALAVPLIFFIAPSKLRYEVHEEAIEIYLLSGIRRFSIGNCLAQPYCPKSSMKTMGSSFPGYHAGRFRVDGMATRVYATDLKKGVLIEGPDLRLFLNPDETKAFLETLRGYSNIEVHAS